MKLIKKIMVVFTAILLVMSMTNRVYAEDTATITVTTPTDGNPAGTDYSLETYKAYKIFDAVFADGSSVSTEGTTQTLTPDTGAVSYKISTSNPWFVKLFTVDTVAGTVSPAEGQTWVVASKTGDSTVYQVRAAGENGASLDDETEAKAFAAWLLNFTKEKTGGTIQENGEKKDTF